jgi:hypothetical protein
LDFSDDDYEQDTAFENTQETTQQQHEEEDTSIVNNKDNSDNKIELQQQEESNTSVEAEPINFFENDNAQIEDESSLIQKMAQGNNGNNVQNI